MGVVYSDGGGHAETVQCRVFNLFHFLGLVSHSGVSYSPVAVQSGNFLNFSNNVAHLQCMRFRLLI